MAWIVDSLRSAIGSLTGRGYGYAGAALPNVFTHQLALVAYMSSGMLRKVIAIPADDRVREWRDWQAPKDDIALIEAEEARLGLQAKVKQAEVLRGIGGGALILVTAGDHSQPLDPETIKEGGLVAINVVSRWQITGRDWIRDLASPDYGKPARWEVASDGRNTPIHPSRVVCFRGEPIPAGAGVSDEEAFWGDSRLLRVYCEVARSDKTQERIAQLVEKAKLTRIGIPDLDSMDEDRIQKRVALIAEGEGIMNATVFRSAGPNGDAGEMIADYQITWNGIPAVMDAFDQRVAAVGDIPFTRLMGRSPAGMNSTGQHDTDNWNKMVGSGQNLETRPCLVQIDPILLRSAGVSKPDEVTWKFAPLWTPTEKEEAETFNTTMDAVTKLMNTGSIPEEAFNEAVQNLLTEREYLPGLDQALEKVPEAERFAGAVDPTEDELDGDPSALAGEDEQRRPFGDARKRRGRGRSAAPANNHFDPTQPRGLNGRWIPAGVRKYVEMAATGSTSAKQLSIGAVGAQARARLNRIGVRAEAKSVALDSSAVRHIIRRHGDERRAGQRNVTGRDIASAQTILNNASLVRAVRAAPTGAPRFATMTRVRSERVYAVFEERKKTLSLVTMWIKK